MKTMMKNFILLLLLLSDVSALDHAQKRVLNGIDCRPNEGRHYVLLVTTFLKTQFCGGNLVSPKWVLTAAHCLTIEEEFKVILGKHGGPEKTVGPISAQKAKIYELNNVPQDIALFELPVTSETGLTTIGLPTNCPAPNTEMYRLMGWSSTKKDQNVVKNFLSWDIPKHLQCADMKLKDCTPYTATEKHSFKYAKENLICAKGDLHEKKGKVTNGGAAVSGDSGGSLVYNENGTPVLYGVTVEGHGDPEVESHFMDVCSFTEWIKTTAGIQ